MRIGLLSDSHGFLDESLLAHFSDCDELWHAGDIGSIEVLDRLEAFNPTRGVYGNVDGGDFRTRLPLDMMWQCEGIRVYMTHIGGYPGRFDRNVKKILTRDRPDLFICGHSHILRVMRDPDLGFLHMNPGACGHSGWHTIRTALRFSVEAGQITGVEAIELGPRGRKPESEKPLG